METADDKLRHFLKIKYGLAPHEPTDDQLEEIKKDILLISGKGAPTEKDWRDVTVKHCPTAGRYKYAGQDMSDLVLLLNLAKGQSES